ncbi:hypothetical protein ACFQT0_21355 [Hymenobacter humi]|uniref:Uncharacterized protein n=1 Tax=Hymenobacter humi TaxID=1411620 RepID=A0ABW2U7Z8_9BACT
MMTLFRTYRRLVLPALLLGAGAAPAQVAPSLPLSADPARAVFAPAARERTLTQRRGTASVALPFFDDFTSPSKALPKSRTGCPPAAPW